MLLLLVECGHVVEVDHNSVDPDANKARGAHLLKDVQMLAFPVTHYRCQQHQFAALGHREYGVHHLGDGLRLQRHAVGRATGVSDPRKQ